MFRFSAHSIERLEGVHPRLAAVMRRALRDSPVDFGIAQGVRTQAEQDALYEQGRTTPGKIVTWTRHSRHIPQADGWGHAVDVAAYVNGGVAWEPVSLYEKIAAAVEDAAKDLGVSIVWGGKWSSPDYGHFEFA